MESEPRSKILEDLLSQGADAAWTSFSRIPSPAASDYRWAGVARFYAQEFDEAHDLFMKAIASGAHEAGIELVTLYRHTGKLELCEEELTRLDLALLSAQDRTLYWRERGVLSYAHGDLPASKVHLLRAWRASYSSRLGPRLRMGIALALAVTYNSLGEPHRAARFAHRAKQGAPAAQLAYLHSVAGLSSLYSGDVNQAKEEFCHARSLLDHAPLLAPVLTYNEALGHLAVGHHEASVNCLEQASAEAMDLDERETEFYAAQLLCATYDFLGASSQAKRALERARALASSQKARGLLLMREGTFYVMRRTYAKEGLKLLRSALAIFGALGIPRETAWAHLHLAHAYHASGDTKSRDNFLRMVADAANGWATSGPVFLELRLLPTLRQHLEALPVASYDRCLLDFLDPDRGLPHVHLTTLGAPCLLVDGERVRLGLRHAVDVIAYLVVHPHTGLKQLLQDVFPDLDNQLAKNYFHQVRHQLSKHVPGFSIVYGKDRTYSLHTSGLTFTCDFLRLSSVLEQTSLDALEKALDAYKAPFLQHREDDWSLVTRERLHVQLLVGGLRILNHQIAADAADERSLAKCIDLAWRLLEVDVGSVEIGRLLIELTHRCDGAMAATQVAQRLCDHYLTILGVVPPEIEACRRGIPQTRIGGEL